MRDQKGLNLVHYTAVHLLIGMAQWSIRSTSAGTARGRAGEAVGVMVSLRLDVEEGADDGVGGASCKKKYHCCQTDIDKGKVISVRLNTNFESKRPCSRYPLFFQRHIATT